MILIIFLILAELFSAAAIRQHFYLRSKPIFYILIIIHVIISLWFWALFISTESHKGFFDSPEHIWDLMQLRAMMIAVILPRTILSVLHFYGKYAVRKAGGHVNWLTNTGLIIYAIIFSVILSGTLIGRFNFRTEEVEIIIKDLDKRLDGLKIVQISDLHLAGFFHHGKLLSEQMNYINELQPDLLLNTGDFITFGWREFNNFDTVLNKAGSRYGNYAVLGNHDFGTYHPDFTEADRANNVLKMNQLVTASGYRVLNDEHDIVEINGARIAIIGITTLGRHPDIVHGDLDKAIMNLDSIHLQILLSHDPNHWDLAVNNKTGIDLTLSGHTHGMQMGIYTRKFRWSPSKYFYPHWGGLYTNGHQQLYVNIGMGVLSVPLRLWMPPEITLIVLKSD